MVTRTQCNHGFVDGVDISHIHLHQAEWKWVSIALCFGPSKQQRWRVCYTHLSHFLWLGPGVHVHAHKMNWFSYSNLKWSPISKLPGPCPFFNTNYLLACGKWNHKTMQIYYNQRCLMLYMQIGCYPLQTVVVKALILLLHFLCHKDGNFTQCHKCIWGRREFWQTSKASSNSQGSSGKSG